MIKLPRRESRVYSIWENGTENFYFKANPAEINELIHMFSEMRTRDHALWIKAGDQRDKSMSGEKYPYNVQLHVPGGISLGMSRRKVRPETYEPTLTVFLDSNDDPAFDDQIALPDNIILHNEVAHRPLQGKVTQPQRNVWHARVQFDGDTPAPNPEDRLVMMFTLWEQGVESGIKIGRVNHKGHFHLALSDTEVEDLSSGNSWLTITVGTWLTDAKPDDVRLSINNLERDRTKVRPVSIHKPRFYYGRILFEDGLPASLVPWCSRLIAS
jgi:hypothetical protein